MRQRLDHDLDEFFKIFVVEGVLFRVLVPRADRLQVRANTEVVDPARLISANDTDPEAPAQHMVHCGDGLRRSQRIMRGRDEPAGDDAQTFRVFAEPHGHERWIVGNLEAFDLEVMFRVTESAVARLVGMGRVFRDFA